MGVLGWQSVHIDDKPGSITNMSLNSQSKILTELKYVYFYKQTQMSYLFGYDRFRISMYCNILSKYKYSSLSCYRRTECNSNSGYNIENAKFLGQQDAGSSGTLFIL